MAIKNIIARGIGFSPASVKFIVTLGFSIGAAAVALPTQVHGMYVIQPENRMYLVPPENRTYLVPPEDRRLIIQ